MLNSAFFYLSLKGLVFHLYAVTAIFSIIVLLTFPVYGNRLFHL